MARFDSSIETAKRLIRLNGQKAILRQFGDSPVPDPDKPWRVGGSDTLDIEVEAVFLDAEEQYLPDTKIEVGDQMVYIAGGGATPTLRDRIYRNGGGRDDEGFSIVHLSTLNPNGQEILHTLQVRS